MSSSSSSPSSPAPAPRIVAPKREHDLLRWFFRDFAPVYLIPGVGYYFLYRRLGVDIYRFLVLMFFLNKVWRLAKWLYAFFVRKGKAPTSYGKWAVITGATNGIGKGFAEELAKTGMNVFLVSRSMQKLTEVAKEIESTYRVETRVFDADFKTIDEATYKRLYDALGPISKDLGILVNNVGVANEDPEYMHELSAESTFDMININIKGTINMTRTVLPILLQNKRGAIINVSSGSGTMPSPLLTVYSSTKAFITQFSNSIHMEYKEFGIDVLVSKPFYVVSNLSKMKKASLLVPSAEQCAFDTLRHLGHTMEVDPYWFHAFLDWVLGNYPKLPQNALRYMKKVKARADSRKNMAPKKTN